jgi:DNA-binding NarL/FixJ family response regulator
VQSQPLRILIWASYPALRAGLSELVREQGFEVVREINSTAGLEATDVSADVLVADLEGKDAHDAARTAELLGVPAVFLLADLESQAAARDLDAGRGWISRRSTGEELASAIRAVAAGLVVLDPDFAATLREEPHGLDEARIEGATQLTGRELDVLRWLALGLPNKAIALKLGISEHTVKFHVGSVLSKLDARSRTEAVTTAARLGLLTL